MPVAATELAATAFKRDYEAAPLSEPAPIADQTPAQGLFDQPLAYPASDRDTANVSSAPAARGGASAHGSDARPMPAVSSDGERRAVAMMKGYTGESCSECGNFTMVRNGTCLKCDTCGSTSGCS